MSDLVESPVMRSERPLYRAVKYIEMIPVYDDRRERAICEIYWRVLKDALVIWRSVCITNDKWVCNLLHKDCVKNKEGV